MSLFDRVTEGEAGRLAEGIYPGRPISTKADALKQLNQATNLVGKLMDSDPKAVESEARASLEMWRSELTEPFLGLRAAMKKLKKLPG